MVDKIPLHEVVSVTRGDGELLRMFQELDVDGSGTLSRAEFEQVLSGACVLRIYVCTCVCCYEALSAPLSVPCICPACVCVCVCVHVCVVMRPLPGPPPRLRPVYTLHACVCV